MLNRQGSVVRVDPATIPSRLSQELEAEQKVGRVLANERIIMGV